MKTYGWGALLSAIAMVMALSAPSALAQIETQTGDTLRLEGTYSDLVFASGDTLGLAVQSSDDVYAAGGEIVADTITAEDLFLAGGDLTVDDATAQNAYIAGGEVEMSDIAFGDLTAAGGQIGVHSGVIEDDLILAGGQITVGASVTIGGSAAIAGGQVSLNAPIGGDLRISGGEVFINSAIGGDVVASGGDVTLGPNAEIAGDYQYHAKSSEIDPASDIGGEVIELEKAPRDGGKEWSDTAGKFAAFFAVAFLVMLIVLSLATAIAFPRLMNESAEMIGSRWLATVGVGFLTIIATPVLIAALFVTFIGAPLALLLITFAAAASALALAVAVYAAGMLIRGLVMRSSKGVEPGVWARIAWTCLGAILLSIVGALPFIGGLVWIVAFVLGLGAVTARGRALLAEG